MIRLSRRVIARLTPEQFEKYSKLMTGTMYRTWTDLIRAALRRFADHEEALRLQRERCLTPDRVSDITPLLREGSPARKKKRKPTRKKAG